MAVISIILPVYNAYPYLAKCLDALVNQTFRDLEILAVNDGSTDESLSVLNRYAAKDGRIKVLNRPNQGVGPARAWALSVARGKYIMFCDSDDAYTPTMCQRMKDTLEQTGTDLVICDCLIKEEAGNGRDTRAKHYHHLNFKGELPLNIQNRLAQNGVLWNKIFRKDIIQQYNITFPLIREHDDVSFVRQYLAVSDKIYGLNEQLYCYVLRRNSLMGKFYTTPHQANRWDVLVSWKHTADFLIQNGKWAAYKDAFIRLFFSNLDWLQWRFKWEQFSDEELKKLATYLQGVPLTKQNNNLEDKLYALQQGLPGFPRTVCIWRTRRIGGVLPVREKISWHEKRISCCGIEIYKEDYRTNMRRWLGLFKCRMKNKS